MLGTNVGIVWPPHIQQWPTMPNNVGICWDKCWHRLARASVFMYADDNSLSFMNDNLVRLK